MTNGRETQNRGRSTSALRTQRSQAREIGSAAGTGIRRPAAEAEPKRCRDEVGLEAAVADRTFRSDDDLDRQLLAKVILHPWRVTRLEPVLGEVLRQVRPRRLRVQI